MLNAATEFRKNGFNDQDAASLGTLAAKFQNVSDEAISASDSASFIISQMIAFGVEANKASTIIDSVNEVANKFSVSSGDLSKALGNVASTAGAMGNSMEETLGMVTAITEQTRNASKASRSLNTIFSRLSQVTDSASDTGKKLTEIYNGLNISLYDNEGQMRSSYDILFDLFTKWDSLSKNQQNYIALISAGSNQLNAFLALMNNFGHATEATETALNSAGSASRENAKYMENLQAKIQALKEEFQEFSTKVLSSDLVKAFLEVGTTVLKFANTDLGQAATKLLLFNVAVQGAVGIFGRFGQIIGKIANPFSGINTILGLFTKNINTAKTGVDAAQLTLEGFGETGTKVTSVLGNIGKAIAAIPKPVLIAVGAIAAIGLAISHFYKSNKELEQSINDSKAAISESESKIQDYNSTLESNRDRIKEIEGLKGTSQWSKDLGQEASALEKQNELLEKQIALEERKKQLEAQKKQADEAKLFERKYGSGLRETKKSADNVYAIEDVTGADAFQVKIDKLSDTIRKFTSTGKEEFKSAAVAAEQSIMDMITELQEYKQTAEDAGDTTQAKYIQSLLDIAMQGASTVGVNATIADSLALSGDNAETASTQFEKLKSALISLGDIEVKPKDADSMEKWVNSLSETDFSHLNDLFVISGKNASQLSNILSDMSGEEAIAYVTQAYKEYYGVIDDATSATNDFKQALETNFSQGIEDMLQMVDYVKQSNVQGVINAKAYNSALEAIYGTTNKELIKQQEKVAEEAYNKSQELGGILQVIGKTVSANYESYFADGVDGVSKFFGQLETLSNTTEKDLQNIVKMSGSMETGDLEVTVEDYGKLSDVLGITETQLTSLFKYFEKFGTFNFGEQTDANAEAIKKLRDNLKSVNDQFSEFDKYRIGGFDIQTGEEGQIDFGKIIKTEGGKEKVQDLVQSINDATKDITGQEISIDINASDEEFVRQAQDAYGYLQQLQQFTNDSGNWDFSGLKDSLKDVEGLNIDGSNITISGEEEVANNAMDKLKQALLGSVSEDSAEGKVILSNFFANMDLSGASEAGQTVADEFKAGVENQLTTTEVAAGNVLNGISEQMGGLGTVSTETKSNIDKVGTSIDDINKKTVDNIAKSFGNANSNATNLLSTATNLEGRLKNLTSKTWTVKIAQSGNVNVPTSVIGHATGMDKEGQPLRADKTQKSLVGEEGAEFLITPSGEKKLVGQNGAEFITVHKGDTIIPAQATAMIRSGQMAGYDGGKDGGKTGASVTLLSKPTGKFQIGEVTSAYSGQVIYKNTSTIQANTQASKANANAKNDIITASTQAASATKELTDAQKEQKDAFDEANEVLEHHIYLAEKNGASYEDLIKMNRKYQKQINEQANWWRSQGFSNDSEQIRALQKQWWQLEDDITSYQEKAFNERYQLSKDYIDDRNDLDDWGADNEVEAWKRVQAWMDEWYKNGLISYDYYLEKRKEATKKAVEAEKKAWKEAKEAEQKRLEDWQNVYEDLFDLVADKAQGEIDKLEEQRDTVEKYWDDKIDALEKANEELDDQIAKEEALDALARARSTKVMVYQDGRFQYINDMDEVSEAKTNLEKIEREQALKQEKENLEKQKEAALKAIDDQIEAWENYKKEWSSVVSDYEKEQKRLNVLQKLGIDLEADNWKQRLGNLQDYVNQYASIMSQLNQLQIELNQGYGSSSGSGAISGALKGSVTGGIKGNSSSGSSSSSSSSSNKFYYTGTSSSGDKYNIGSSKGQSFIDNARPGSTMIGGDGSTWTKNNDGSTTISKGDKTYSVPASKSSSKHSKRANGTKWSPRGLSLVGEEGAELRVLGQGEGIIPHDMTANLFEWGQTRPSDIVSAITGVQDKNSGVMICIENFNPSLPNVVDGEGFANYLKNNFWRNVVQYKTTMGRA